jgi:cytochrome-b5 reductase
MSLKIGMIAGGTGITPMLVRPLTCLHIKLTLEQQIIRAALKNPLDVTQMSLVYANVNEADILLKKELDELAAAHPLRFKVYYVLNNPPENWNGGVGFVTAEHIKERLPAPASTMKMLLCGYASF